MSERTTRAAQKESDHQRWADDGGFIPEPAERETSIAAGSRNPWIVVGVAAAIGFTLGWMSGRR